MQNIKTISIKDYLERRGIPFIEKNGELVTQCLFNDCDIGKGNLKDCHLYFNKDTGQYDCKKCGTKGNIFTLTEFLGDDKKEIIKTEAIIQKTNKEEYLDISIVNKCHNNLPPHIRYYLHGRGIKDEMINKYKLGWGNFYGCNWITIPVKDEQGNYLFFKLRKDTFAEDNRPKYLVYPKNHKSSLFNIENLKDNKDYIVICEGEFDSIILEANNIKSITSTTGVNSFKDEWINEIKDFEKIYVCFDTDAAGKKGADSLIERLKDKVSSETGIYNIDLSDVLKKGKDITDYFVYNKGNKESFLSSLPRHIVGIKPIDVTKFNELNSEDILKTLGITIKRDEENKLVTFLCMLSAYTENGQFNISFNAPSSTGKSYIPTEISKLFPKKDVVELGYCSPTAFFHEVGEYNKKKRGFTIDLSRKILVFLDQPHTQLLERLRPLLSHDKKEMQMKITDKSSKGGMKTKNVFIKGYPSVIFCSAGLRIDEQEGTRFILLSPEISNKKIRSAIIEKIKKETDHAAYYKSLNNNSDRILLKERIEAIKREKIDNIKIEDGETIESDFLYKRKILKPRHQRDIGSLLSLIKGFALLNAWFRKREGHTIIADARDIREGMLLWNILSQSQEYNLPPYIYDIYKDVIVPCYENKNKYDQNEKIGLTGKDIQIGFNKLNGRIISSWRLRQDILPMLETAGLIKQEKDINDKRKVLISPITII